MTTARPFRTSMLRDVSCNSEDQRCLLDLMSPIAPTNEELALANSFSQCSVVSETMSHLLWGEEWADNSDITGPKAIWTSVTDTCADQANKDVIQDSCKPWEDKTCEAEEMKDFCVKRAVILCENAFGALPQVAEGTQTADVGNFNRFVMVKDFMFDPHGPAPYILVVLVFLISLAYAGVNEKLHQSRQQMRQRRQMEESVSMSNAGNRVAPEGSSGVDYQGTMDNERMLTLEERNNKFFNLMYNKDNTSNTPSAGTLRFWDINFEEQDMEDMFRKMQLMETLLQFRWLVISGLMFIIGYQFMLTSSRVEIQWGMRILLVIYCLLIVPFTFDTIFVSYQAFADSMFSNSMIVIAVVFIFISYLDKFNGTPTESFLMMGLVIGLNTTIMFVTGTVWFRKFLITFAVCVFYTIIARVSIRSCVGYDQFMNGDVDSGVQIDEMNRYPSIQIIPDYDSFKYHMSCSQKNEDFNFVKQNMFVYLISFLTWYTCYYWEKNKRQEFGKKWALLKNKLEMEKKIRQFQDKQNQSIKKKENLFGEIRDLNFKSPMQKVLDTVGKIKIAVGDDRPVLDALGIIEDTLKNNSDLNKVDIHKAEGLDQADREIAKFILSAGGGGKSRERVRSVPNLAVDIDPEKLFSAGGTTLISEAGHPPNVRELTDAHSQIITALEKFEDWDFDTNKFAFITKGNPMYYLFMKHMDKFYHTFNLDVEPLRLFVLYAEEHYCFDPNDNNPYHTNLHSADVLQTVGAIMNAPIVRNKLDSLDKFTALVASMMHDYRHKGVNNSFLVNSSDELALVHNDSSVLERFHASEMFLLLNNQKLDMDFSKNMNADDYRQFRTVSISMILATDLSQGYSYIAAFKLKVTDNPARDWGETKEDVALLLQMILKVADVSHPSKTLNSHLIWSVMITEEFFYQGDLEKANNMAISPLCDRVNNFDIPKSQKGFIDFVVSPTMKPVAELLGLQVILDNLKSNYRYWSERHKEHTAKQSLEQSFPALIENVNKLKAEWGAPPPAT